MNIKEQLEQYIEKESKIDSMRISGPIPLNAKCFEIGFQRGANEMKELLLIVYKALEKYGRASVFVASEDCNISITYKALAEIQEKIKGE